MLQEERVCTMAVGNFSADSKTLVWIPKRLMERYKAANNLWILTEISKKPAQQRKKNGVHLIKIHLH